MAYNVLRVDGRINGREGYHDMSKQDGGDGAEQGGKQHRFLGSLKDALMAAGRSDAPAADAGAVSPALEGNRVVPPPPAVARVEVPVMPVVNKATAVDAETIAVSPKPAPPPNKPSDFADAMTRAIRGSDPRKSSAGPPRTQLVRGRVEVARGEFHQDPVVGWLVVVGGSGLGAFRPIFEGNNTIGRGRNQRIAIDFGDETISSEEQAYIRYDSADRSFLFVPNLSKTNVVSINNRKPTTAVPLQAMDVITMGRTQLAFVPFCGADFDWSELADGKN